MGGGGGGWRDLVNSHQGAVIKKHSLTHTRTRTRTRTQKHTSASGESLSDVELGDGPLTAAVGVGIVGPLAVALHLGQVLVEDLARAQRRHQVVKLAVLLTVLLRLTGLTLLIPLLLQLRGQTERERER